MPATVFTRAAIATAALGLACLATLPARASDVISLMLDNATIIKVPEKTATLVVGNPMIADVAMQKNGIMVLTGKAYGETNLLALDEGGALVSETRLRVQRAQRNTVVVVRGIEPETYSCTPECAPTLTLGDSEKHFGKVGGQTTNRNQLAVPQGAPR
jgi:Flp pilus assembly secretin CpaC